MVRYALLDNIGFVLVGAPALFIVALGTGTVVLGLSAVAALALAVAVTVVASVLAVRTDGSDGGGRSADDRSRREKEMDAKKGSYGSDH